MADWAGAIGVAASGIFSVFLVLILLQVSVQLTGVVVNGVTQRQKEKQN